MLTHLVFVFVNCKSKTSHCQQLELQSCSSYIGWGGHIIADSDVISQLTYIYSRFTLQIYSYIYLLLQFFCHYKHSAECT